MEEVSGHTIRLAATAISISNFNTVSASAQCSTSAQIRDEDVPLPRMVLVEETHRAFGKPVGSAVRAVKMAAEQLSQPLVLS
jgi:hypothetical protein